MTLFRSFLVVLLLTLSAYTAVVIAHFGIDLLPLFFGDIFEMAWAGQFNLDFLFMLSLSALWVSWRHQFSATGFVLGFFALIGGALFLTIYLLVLSYQCQGDVKTLLLGNRA
ncbi:MAG: hypothetical protein ACRC24_06160 [Vibrionaceae bacterium]